MKGINMRKPLALLAAACVLCGQAGAAAPVSGTAETALVTVAGESDSDSLPHAAGQESVVLSDGSSLDVPVDPFLDFLKYSAGAEAELCSNAGAGLTGCSRELYEYIGGQVEKLLAGGRDDGDPWSTEFSKQFVFSPFALNPGEDKVEKMSEKVDENIDRDSVIDALFADFPYTMFWRDMAYESRWFANLQGSTLTVDYTCSIRVAEDYRDGDEYHVLPNLGEQTAAVVEKAKSIVALYADQSDYGKLTAYRDTICDLVSYNEEAASNENTPYGNPWQLIWVFDGDPSTNVVCEGYAKAFKYLCDLSQFQDPNFECILVNGTMEGGTGAGQHMWNHVFLDGKAYLADITNSDSDSSGYGGGLFLDTPVSGFHTADRENTSRYLFEVNGDLVSYFNLSSYLFDLYPPEYLILSETSYRSTEDFTNQIVLVLNGNQVRVTTGGFSAGQTAWAAAYTDTGKMTEAVCGTLDNSGTALLPLPVEGAARIQAFVLDNDTLCPLLPSASLRLS